MPARIAALVALFMLPVAAQAAVVSFAFSLEFSGAQAPVGTAPWVSATFTDVAANQVRLQLSASGLSGSESIRGAYFNLDPLLAPGSLGFAYVSGDAGTQASVPIQTGTDCCKADGDGRFDMQLGFGAGSGFDAGETATYDITYGGSGSFSAAAFAFLSQPAGGNGPFYAAAHVQNTGGGAGSGWIAPQGFSVQETSPVPLPAGLLAAGLGMPGLGAFRRLRA